MLIECDYVEAPFPSQSRDDHKPMLVKERISQGVDSSTPFPPNCSVNKCSTRGKYSKKIGMTNFIKKNISWIVRKIRKDVNPLR
ncbi:hypothetical protein NPIL_444601 [Nephila pilipes]|uniref:Uncharacterized protein n=1 Tax=Nephila pilipes TaxID=299642 RepID=A0A8X6PVW1_NEPPI|nr:hypothetical protein NPIL_444601 [Nephila pilipes]